MIRIASAILAAAFVCLASSCGCCTSDAEAPGLRPLPQFQEIQSPEVSYTK
jgi:hypothetical protein